MVHMNEETKQTRKITVVAGAMTTYCQQHLMSLHDIEIKEEAKEDLSKADIVVVLPKFEGHEPIDPSVIKGRSERGQLTKVYSYAPKAGEQELEQMEKQYEDTLFIEYLSESDILTYRKIEMDIDVLALLYENVCRIGGAEATYPNLIEYIQQEFGYVTDDQGHRKLNHQGIHKHIYIEESVAKEQLTAEVQRALEEEAIQCHILG